MNQDHTTISEPKRPSFGILLWLGVLLVMLAAVLGAFWLNRTDPATESEDLERATLRTKNLIELQAADSNILSTYGWNDKAKGIVHIPVSRAMELVLPSLQATAAKEQP